MPPPPSNNDQTPQPPSPLPPNDPSRPQPSLLQGLQTLSTSDVTDSKLLQKPCVRDSLMVGLGAGFAIGGTRFIFSTAGGSGGGFLRPRARLAPGMKSAAGSKPASARAPLVARQWGAMSWAVGAFVLGSVGMHLFCQRRRQLELESMRLVREAMERKREEKRAEMLEQQQQRRRARTKQDQDEQGGWGTWLGR